MGSELPKLEAAELGNRWVRWLRLFAAASENRGGQRAEIRNALRSVRMFTNPRTIQDNPGNPAVPTGQNYQSRATPTIEESMSLCAAIAGILNPHPQLGIPGISRHQCVDSGTLGGR